MDRRTFIQRTSVGAMALSMPTLPDLFKEMGMGVVVHSYGSRWNSKTPSTKYPGFANAIDLLDHCHKIGSGGVQVVVNRWTDDFAKSVRDRREKLGMYLEGSISMPKKPEDVPAFEQDVIRAKEAGARVLRSVCSNGRRYENLHSAAEFATMQKNAMTSMKLAEPVLRKQGVKLALENHKDWRSKELAAMMKEISSEWIGVTLDFGNNMALMEDPMDVVQTLAPFVVSTHVKDMGLEAYADGFLLSEVPLGKGVLDLPTMVAVCKKSNPAVTFNLEMITRDPLEIPCLKQDYWATFGNVPGAELAHMLRLVQQQKSTAPLPRTAQLSAEDKLAAEEQNIVACLDYSKGRLGLK
ncbi:MAG: sugar phosphate isomerase/epimerase [Rudanella sp.]|nr:sugar phosphate isomerase/epimerase [Rudanella sp.]